MEVDDKRVWVLQKDSLFIQDALKSLTADSLLLYDFHGKEFWEKLHSLVVFLLLFTFELLVFSLVDLVLDQKDLAVSPLAKLVLRLEVHKISGCCRVPRQKSTWKRGPVHDWLVDLGDLLQYLSFPEVALGRSRFLRGTWLLGFFILLKLIVKQMLSLERLV